MQRWLILFWISLSIRILIFFKILSAVSISTVRFHRTHDVSRDFFIAVCLLYKYEMREHTDGYTVILFLCPRSIFAQCNFNIFVFHSYQWTRCIPADSHVSRIT